MKTTKTKHVRPLSPFGGRGASFSPFGGRGAFLLLLLWVTGGFASAQSIVPQSSDFDNHQHTFAVNGNDGKTSWVWVEYRKVTATGTAYESDLTRATISGHSSGTLVAASKGLWVAGNAMVTVTLSGVPDKYGWCAYASNTPPSATLNPAGGYDLHGTTPFTVNNVPLADGVTTFGAGTCIATITDATGNPAGIIPPAPAVSTSNPAAICSNTAAALSCTVSGGTTTAMTYTWKVGAEGTQTTTANTYSPTVSAGSTYSVTVTNASGCVSTAATGTITVNAVPAAPTSASSNTRCGSGTVTFSATTATGCTIDWYNASSSGSTVSSGSASYTTTVSAGATATCYAQSRHTTTGCVSASRLAVTGIAYAVPTVGTTNPAAICGTGAVTLTATASGGTTTAMTYTWKVGAAAAQTTTANTYNAAAMPVGSTTYSVTVTNANGCTSAAATGTITVNAVPAAPTGASSNTRCGTGNVTFSATTATGCTIDWYNASSSGSTVSSGSASYTTTVSAGATATYYAQSRNTTTGCVSASRLAVTGIAYAVPTVGTTSPATVCYNTAAALSCTVSGGTTTAMTYTWKIGTATTTTTAPSVTSTNLTAATTYSVTAANAYGCTSTAATGTIPVYNEFTAGTITTASATTTEGAKPNVTVANATSASGGNGSITYQWRRSGSSAATLTGSNATYALNTDAANYSTAGTYNIKRYAKDGTCNTAFTASIGQYTLTVDPPKTYTCGTQMWSEPVRIAACDKASLINSTTTPDCRSYTHNGITYYYYNWAYVNANAAAMCPAPWHVPTYAEYATLINFLGASGGDGVYYPESSTWGGATAGYAESGGMYSVGSYSYYWTTSAQSDTMAWFLNMTGGNTRMAYGGKAAGMQVKCVQ